MSGRRSEDASDGFFDEEGDWASWAWTADIIDGNHREQPRKPAFQGPQFPSENLSEMVSLALLQDELPGVCSPLWGKIGERFGEEYFGVRLHRDCAQGSDGKIGDEFVEIKTITPAKARASIVVKRSGHFSLLLIVRVDKSGDINGILIPRNVLNKGSGKAASLAWSSVQKPTSSIRRIQVKFSELGLDSD